MRVYIYNDILCISFALSLSSIQFPLIYGIQYFNIDTGPKKIESKRTRYNFLSMGGLNVRHSRHSSTCLALRYHYLTYFLFPL